MINPRSDIHGCEITVQTSLYLSFSPSPFVRSKSHKEEVEEAEQEAIVINALRQPSNPGEKECCNII